MTNVQAMLETHPNHSELDAAGLSAVIEALIECANTCTQCAEACLAEDPAMDMRSCIRRNLDCAEICLTTSHVLGRQTGSEPEVPPGLIDACIAACRSCADECSRHEDMEHCLICSYACRTCEQACREFSDVSG